MLFCKWKHAAVIVVSFIYNVGAVADMQYYPPEMQSDLLAAYLAKGKDYQARTANFLNEVWQHQQPLVLQRADEVARAVASTQQNKQQSHALDTTLLKFPNNYLW